MYVVVMGRFGVFTRQNISLMHQQGFSANVIKTNLQNDGVIVSKSGVNSFIAKIRRDGDIDLPRSGEKSVLLQFRIL